MADRVYTPAEIEESKRKALLAFYEQRSGSLRRNTTTTQDGALASKAKPPQGALSPRPRRSGILGYIADAYQDATGQ